MARKKHACGGRKKRGGGKKKKSTGGKGKWMTAVMKEYRKNKKAGLGAAMRKAKKNLPQALNK